MTGVFVDGKCGVSHDSSGMMTGVPSRKRKPPPTCDTSTAALYGEVCHLNWVKLGTAIIYQSYNLSVISTDIPSQDCSQVYGT